MARRRYQRGHLRLRGKREKVWVAMWREDVIAPDGTTRRIRKSEVLGTLKEYKTRRLAERALEQRLSDVNSLTYKPRPTATFSEFAKSCKGRVAVLNRPMSLNRMSEVRSGVFLDSE
jgi:hypothetical protein